LQWLCIGRYLDYLRTDLEMNRRRSWDVSTLARTVLSYSHRSRSAKHARGHEAAILFATLAIALRSVRAWPARG